MKMSENEVCQSLGNISDLIVESVTQRTVALENDLELLEAAYLEVPSFSLQIHGFTLTR